MNSHEGCRVSERGGLTMFRAIGLALVVLTTGGVAVRGALADVAPGDKINASNVAKAKDLLSPGMEWCVKRGFPITVVESKRVEWPKAYKEAPRWRATRFPATSSSSTRRPSHAPPRARSRSRRCAARRSAASRSEMPMPQFETMLFDVSDRVATITLNRPDRLNAMNQTLKDELRECWRLVKNDPEVWVAILTGAGKAFSTGADVEGLAAGGFTRVDRWRELALIEGIVDLPTPRRQRVFKPVIAAVNGAVAGFSLDLVTETDIPIASEQAYFVDPHVSLGLVSSHVMVNLARGVPGGVRCGV